MPAETHVERSPIGPDDVFRIVRERLAEILEVDDDRDHARLRLRDDLDADSLALIELVEALEEELGERTVGLQHRRRRPRRPAHRARRGRLRRRTGSGAGDVSRPGDPMAARAGGAVDPALDARLAARARVDVRRPRPARPRARRTGRGARSTASRSRTSGSSSSATPCSASSSPHYVFERVPAAARGPAGRSCAPGS